MDTGIVRKELAHAQSYIYINWARHLDTTFQRKKKLVDLNYEFDYLINERAFILLESTTM